MTAASGAPQRAAPVPHRPGSAGGADGLGGGSPWGTEVDWWTGTLRVRERGRPAPVWQPAPQPGTLPKRPLTFMETLDSGFRLLRFSPGATFGIAMIVCALGALVAALVVASVIMGSLGALQRLAMNPEAGMGLNLVVQTGASAASLASLSLVLPLSAFAAIAADAAVSRERMRLGEVWQRLRGRRLRLAGLTALAFAAHLVLLGIALTPGLLLLLVSPVAAVLLATLGILCWVAATIWLFAKVSLSGAAIAVEDLGPVTALRRSWDLTRGAFWRSMGQYVVSYVLAGQVMNLILGPLLFILMMGFVIALLLVTLSSGEAAFSLFAIVMTAGLGLLAATAAVGASALLYAYLSGVVAVVYLDRRMRREGYDLVLLRRAEMDEARARKNADALPPSTADPAAAPSAVDSGGAHP